MPAPSLSTLTHRGTELSPEAAADLEAALAAHPADLPTRGRLIGFYFNRHTPEARARHSAHVHWLIENHPEVSLGPYNEIIDDLDPEGYQEGKRRWLAHLAAQPDHLPYLRNASRFLSLTDADLADELRRRAAALEPHSPEWPLAIGQARLRTALASDTATERIGLAREALAAFETTLTLTAASYRHTVWPELAEAAVEAGELTRAREAAEASLACAGLAPGWSGHLVHTGHIVLGRVALARGDLAGAREHLAAAGATTGGPALDSFGPDLTLASALLERGERAAVAAYLAACTTFWTFDQGCLARWQAALARGETPVLDKLDWLSDDTADSAAADAKV